MVEEISNHILKLNKIMVFLLHSGISKKKSLRKNSLVCELVGNNYENIKEEGIKRNYLIVV